MGEASVGEARSPTARLFVALWPPEEVVAAIRALARPDLPDVRWTTSEQWHVTLAFVGEVAETRVRALDEALQQAAAVSEAPEATLGPLTARYGRGVLGVPVTGLEELAAAVHRALAAVPAPGGPASESPGRDAPAFVGHLTLARGRRGRPVPGRLVGVRLAARWRAHEVCLVRSTLDPGGARYTTIGRATLQP